MSPKDPEGIQLLLLLSSSGRHDFAIAPLTADKTIKNYEIHQRQFGRFVALKGNYESMLMRTHPRTVQL